MAEHPWAKDVRLAVNFEARGDAGVSSLFETSAGNGVLVREAASAVPGLVGSSLAYEVYKRMPNDTDATVFKAHGLPALNFAFVGHWDAYHTPRDDPDHLDRGSLQQQGNYALGLARRFATVDLGALGAPDAVYFSLPGGFFVHYEHSVGLAFAVLAGLLGAYVTWKALRRRDATPLGLLGGVAFFATSLVVLGGVGFLVASFAEGAHARFLPEGDVLGSAPYVCAAIALAIGMWSALFALARRKISTDDMALGSAAALVALAIVTSVEGVGVAGVAYLLVWPGAGAAAQSLVKRESATGPIMTLLLSVPALAIIVPLLHAVFEGLGMSPPGGALVCILVGLLAASLVRPLETVRAWSPRWVTLAPLVAGVILLAWGMAVTRVSAAHPKASQLLYVVDFDTHTARWATTAERVDAWSSQLVGTSPARDALFPGWRSPCLQGEPREPLAVAAGAPAWLKVVDSTLANGERTVQLVVHPSRDGDLDLETATGVLDATVNGKPVPTQAKAGPWTLRYIGASKDVGVALSLRVKGNAHIPLFITTRTAGVPDEAGRTERPAWSVTQHDGDRTLSRRRIDL